MTTRTQLADPRTVRRAGVARRMNKSEAQQLTTQIRATAHGLWKLVAEAYDRKAWQALGYESWRDYATQELQMSESRSYQLVDTGRVMRAIGQVAGEGAFETVVITARETARIKPHLSTFTRELEAAIKDGADPVDAVDTALEALPSSEKRPPAPRGARVVEGEVVEQPVEPELPHVFGTVTVPPPAAARPVPAPLFTGPSQVEQPRNVVREIKIPAGKQLCDHCSGLGYVDVEA